MPRDLIWDGVVRKRDSLDHIHPKPANLGEQLPITGIKDLLTAANRLLDPTEELWSFWLLLQWQFRNHRGSVHWKIRFGIPYNRKGKYWCPSIFAIYLEVNHKKKNIFEQKIEVGRNSSTSMCHCRCPSSRNESSHFHIKLRASAYINQSMYGQDDKVSIQFDHVNSKPLKKETRRSTFIQFLQKSVKLASFVLWSILE